MKFYGLSVATDDVLAMKPCCRHALYYAQERGHLKGMEGYRCPHCGSLMVLDDNGYWRRHESVERQCHDEQD